MMNSIINRRVVVCDIVYGMVLGAVVATIAMHETFLAHQNFDMLMPGREAAVWHLVLRISVRSTALAMTVLMALRRYLCNGHGSEFGILLALVEVGAALFASSGLCLELERIALSVSPGLAMPISSFGGWRAIQLLDLVLTSVSIVLFVVFADYLYHKIVGAKSLKLRVVYTVLAVIVFGGLASPAPRLVRECIVRDAREAVERDDEYRPVERDWRLNEDEPWVLNG